MKTYKLLQPPIEPKTDWIDDERDFWNFSYEIIIIGYSCPLIKYLM